MIMRADNPESPRVRRARLQKRALRGVGITLSALMVVTVLSILFLIVRTERAHDEGACKFALTSQRDLGSVQVLEERRSCVPELEERRYLVQRSGKERYELARKRLPKAHFTSDRYKWTLREDDQHLLVLRIDVDGALLSESFEEDVR
jgi:hypothetical protein